MVGVKWYDIHREWFILIEKTIQYELCDVVFVGNTRNTRNTRSTR